MTDPRRPRDELANQIMSGNVSTKLIATVLLEEVLPALDRIKAQLGYMGRTLNEHLGDLTNDAHFVQPSEEKVQ